VKLLHSVRGVIFLDIDGTLVGRRDEVSARMVRAVHAACGAGCEVVLCTGRSLVSSRGLAGMLGLRGPLIASNGAVAVHLEGGEVLVRNTLSSTTVAAAIRALLRAGVAPMVYADALGDTRILHLPEHPPLQRNPERHRPWQLLERPLPFDPVSVCAFGPESRVRPVADALAASPPEGAAVQQSGTHAAWSLEVHHRESSKLAAAMRVLARLGVPAARALAIGDHLNDLPLLRAVGRGVAMGNSQPEVRNAVRHVTGTVEEDGAAAAIEQWLLDARAAR
jgi:Cof subfamily protein (haloacid dehalogenase superfamily)